MKNRPFWISLALSVGACAVIMALLASDNTRLSDQLADERRAAAQDQAAQGRAGIGRFSKRDQPAGSSEEKVERAVAQLERFTSTIPPLVPGKSDKEQPADRGLFWDKLPELLRAVEGLSVEELIAVAERMPVEDRGDEEPLFFNKTLFNGLTIGIPADSWPNVVRDHLLMLAAEQDPWRFYLDEDANEMSRFSTLKRLARVDPAAAVNLMPQFSDKEGKRMGFDQKSRLIQVVLESDVGVGLDFLMETRPGDPTASAQRTGWFALGANGPGTVRFSPSTIRQLAEAIGDPEYQPIRNDLIQFTLDHHLRENGIGEVAYEAGRMGLTSDEISRYIDTTRWITMKTSPRETIEWMSANLTADQQASRIPDAVVAWAGHDVYAAADWLGYQNPSPARDRAIAKFATKASDLDPESARLWANEIQDEVLRAETLREVTDR